MKKLTETLIKQRVRSCVTDINKVIQINLTGRDLEDVSLLRKMTNVEILSLSFNKITNLDDFENCENLKELYLRRNNIADLNEIRHLKHLTKLELLMLSENPCSAEPNYRSTIIKNLPTLQTLDGLTITTEERRLAAKNGRDVTIPATPNHVTPTQSSHTIKVAENSSKETFEEGNLSKKLSTEDVVSVTTSVIPDSKSSVMKSVTKNPGNVHGTTSSLYTLRTRKSSRQLSRNDSKKCLTKFKEPKTIPCKSNKNQSIEAEFMTNTNLKKPRSPNNPNLLSAILALVKELDFSGLQIVNAEIQSRFNSLEVEYLYDVKTD